MRAPIPAMLWLCVRLLLVGLEPGGVAHAGEAYTLRALARTGDPVPGGGSFDRFGQEALPIIAPVNARGDVAFFATLSRGVSDEAIFLQRAGRIVAVAREGDRVAGVGQLSGFGKHPTPALNDAGTVAFAAALTGGRAVEGIFTWSAGRLRAIATTGTAVPGMPSTVLAGVDAPTINARGDVVFLATVRRGRESSEAILASRGGMLRKVVAQGDAAPAGGVFATFGSPTLNGSGNVAFAAVVEGKTVPGGIFVASRDRIEMAVAAGADTPIGGIFAKFSERIAYNDAGAIAFHGILKFAPVSAAIFVVEHGRPRAVARLGDAAPDGGTIAHFGLWPAIDSTGAATFAASVENGPTAMAILQANGGGLTRIVGVGDPLPGGGRIASFTLYPVVSVGPRGHVSFAVAPTATSEGPEGLFAAQPASIR